MTVSDAMDIQVGEVLQYTLPVWHVGPTLMVAQTRAFRDKTNRWMVQTQWEHRPDGPPMMIPVTTVEFTMRNLDVGPDDGC